MEFQATLKQAVDKEVITFNIGEYKFVWASTNQPIAVLQPVADKNEIQQLAEYFITGGDKVTAIYDRIKSMVKGEKQLAENV